MNVYLIRRDHLRPRDKDDGHTVRSAVAENPMLHSHFFTLGLSVEPELLSIELVLYCGNREFLAFSSCDLDLDPMTFIYDLDPYPLKTYLQTENELSTSRFSKVIVSHTDRQIMPPQLLPRL